jgi:hypothetical protein
VLARTPAISKLELNIENRIAQLTLIFSPAENKNIMNISKDEMRFKDGCDETRIIQLSIFKIFFVLEGVPKKPKALKLTHCLNLNAF